MNLPEDPRRLNLENIEVHVQGYTNVVSAALLSVGAAFDNSSRRRSRGHRYGCSAPVSSGFSVW